MHSRLTKNFCFNGSAALKVLSSAMDLAEIRFIRSSLKGEVRKFSEKSARTSSCESPLKIPGHLVQLLASRILIPNGAHSSVSMGREEEADGQALVPATVFQSLNSMSSPWLGTSSCAQICIYPTASVADP